MNRAALKKQIAHLQERFGTSESELPHAQRRLLDTIFNPANGWNLSRRGLVLFADRIQSGTQTADDARKLASLPAADLALFDATAEEFVVRCGELIRESLPN